MLPYLFRRACNRHTLASNNASHNHGQHQCLSINNCITAALRYLSIVDTQLCGIQQLIPSTTTSQIFVPFATTCYDTFSSPVRVAGGDLLTVYHRCLFPCSPWLSTNTRSNNYKTGTCSSSTWISSFTSPSVYVLRFILETV